MSNSNDGFNLERLEMIGDSFLKQAVTTYLYCTYPQMHEGRLSYFRSKQVSNYNLYKLGRRKGFASCMIATKFEPSENWLPPGFCISQDRAFPIAKWAIEQAQKEKEKKAKAAKAKAEAVEAAATAPAGDVALEANATKEEAQDSKTETTPSNGGGGDGVASPEVDEGVEKMAVEEGKGGDIILEETEKVTEKEDDKDGREKTDVDIGVRNEAGDHADACGQNEMIENGGAKADGILNEDGDAKTDKPDGGDGDGKVDAVSSQATTEASGDASSEVARVKPLDLSKLHAKLYRDTAIEHLPYILQIQHTLPDKSIADCVEALIGCYLTECGPRGALLLMAWLGLKVLPKRETEEAEMRVTTTTTTDEAKTEASIETTVSETTSTTTVEVISSNQTMETDLPKPGQSTDDNVAVDDSDVAREALHSASTAPLACHAHWGQLLRPPSPILDQPKSAEKLESLLTGFDRFEKKIDYVFKDRAYLLQAFTHASYHYNDITDCYQRLEFLGDAVLDYVITRHLYEDDRKHSPGELTDLRSALVNNNIFAALAVRYDYHKYFKALSVGLFHVIEKYVALQNEQGDIIDVDQFTQTADADSDSEDSEETEVPKALGDVFESVAGAIFLDSGFSFDAVWRVYFRMMQPLIDKYSAKVPKSPVRELLEMEPETAKFEKPERTVDARVRVAVTVIGKGKWKGVGRNYRIAKCAAAKKALKALKEAGDGRGD